MQQFEPRFEPDDATFAKELFQMEERHEPVETDPRSLPPHTVQRAWAQLKEGKCDEWLQTLLAAMGASAFVAAMSKHEIPAEQVKAALEKLPQGVLLGIVRHNMEWVNSGRSDVAELVSRNSGSLDSTRVPEVTFHQGNRLFSAVSSHNTKRKVIGAGGQVEELTSRAGDSLTVSSNGHVIVINYSSIVLDGERIVLLGRENDGDTRKVGTSLDTKGLLQLSERLRSVSGDISAWMNARTPRNRILAIMRGENDPVPQMDLYGESIGGNATARAIGDF